MHNSRLCLCSFTSQLLQLSPFLLSSLGLKWTLPSICTQSLGQVFLIFCTVLSGIFSLTKSGHPTPFPPLFKSSQITFFSRCPTTDVHVYWCRYWSVCCCRCHCSVRGCADFFSSFFTLDWTQLQVMFAFCFLSNCVGSQQQGLWPD